MNLSRSKPMEPTQMSEPIIRSVQRGRLMINQYSTDPDYYDPDCMDNVACIDEYMTEPVTGSAHVRPNIR